MSESQRRYLKSDIKSCISMPDMTTEAGQGQTFKVIVTTGKEMPRSFRTGNSVRWIDVFLQPEGERQPRPIGKAEITESQSGLRAGGAESLYQYHEAVLEFKIDSSGMIRASLLQNSKVLARC